MMTVDSRQRAPRTRKARPSGRAWFALVLAVVICAGARGGVAMGGEASPVPLKHGEFRGTGTGLVCHVVADAGEPPPDGYEPCLHIGPFAVRQAREAVEALLGHPVRELEAGEGGTHGVYLLPQVEAFQPYMVITYREGIVVAVQLTGERTDRDYALSSIRLGDAAGWVLDVLGAPHETRDVPEVQAEFWGWSPFPVSVEIKDGKVYSLRVALPAR